MFVVEFDGGGALKERFHFGLFTGRVLDDERREFVASMVGGVCAGRCDGAYESAPVCRIRFIMIPGSPLGKETLGFLGGFGLSGGGIVRQAHQFRFGLAVRDLCRSESFERVAF